VGVEDTNTVDFIGTDRTSGETVLTLVDALDWSEPHEHLVLLEEKLNTYLRFIESGEIYEQYPPAQGRDMAIEIAAKHSFPDCAKEFFEHAEDMTKNAGVRLCFKHIDA
jgi:hypothetical protein